MNTLNTVTTNTTTTNQGNTMNNEAANLLINELSLTTYQELQGGNTIPKNVLTAVEYGVASKLANIVTPVQAILCGTVMVNVLHYLLEKHNYRNLNTKILALAESAQVTIQGETTKVEAFDIIDLLVQQKFIMKVGIGTEQVRTGHVAGASLIKIINSVRSAMRPTEAAYGINRQINYAINPAHISPMAHSAIDALESTQSMKSVMMEEIAVQVLALVSGGAKKQMVAEQYVLDGVAKMKANTAYVSEFHFDKRGRMYQSACHGYNSQSSDYARSFQDFYGVSTDYNSAEMIEVLMTEIADMTSLEGENMDKAIAIFAKAPVASIVKVLSDTDSKIKKVWSFAKFAILITELRAGNKPYIGVACGLDAKGSCAQIGALMVGDETVLKATGFANADTNPTDIYNLALASVQKSGLDINVNRNDMKKPFMSIYYGAGVDAMCSEKTIEKGAFDALWVTGKDFMISGEAGNRTVCTHANQAMAKTFHAAIVDSFGHGLGSLRDNIKSLGKGDSLEDGTTQCRFIDSKLVYSQVDGFVIDMDYKYSVNIKNDITRFDDGLISAQLVVGNVSQEIGTRTFKTTKKDLSSNMRTAFVNLVQGTDALIARAIIVHANKLGAKHITCIHDCFRVAATEQGILKQAIINAYKELFSNETDAATEHYESTDILAAFNKGCSNSTVEGFTMCTEDANMFDTDGYRVLRTVGGVKISTIIDNLGNEGNNSFYFAK